MIISTLIIILLGLFNYARADIDASSFLVKTLPYLEPGTDLPEIHAGLIEVGSKIGIKSGGHLFFYHVKSLAEDAKTTIIWFNGGPGCSSMDGNFLEIGPLRFNSEGKLIKSPDGSWAETSNLLFVDQPFGTGYSDPDENVRLSKISAAGDAVVQFLSAYADIFPEILNTDIYLAGESFAGQYIPYIWKSLKSEPEINDKIGGIAGVILGNPWIDPANQYLSYSQFTKDNNLIPQDTWTKFDDINSKCLSKLAGLGESIPISVDECEQIPEFALKSGGGDSKHCFNIYKINELSPYPSCGMEWPVEVPSMTSWLSKPEVKEALHVHSKRLWVECSGSVSSGLRFTKEAPSVHLLPELLNEVPVLLLVGDQDYICNKYGLDRFVNNLEWAGQVGITTETEKTSYGSWSSDRNLTVAHIKHGSHMIPVDDLKTSHDVVKRFIYGTEETPEEPQEQPHDNAQEKPQDENHEEPQNGSEEKPSEKSSFLHRFFSRAANISAVLLVISFIIILFLILRKYLKSRHTNQRDEYLLQTLDQNADEFEI